MIPKMDSACVTRVYRGYLLSLQGKVRKCRAKEIRGFVDTLRRCMNEVV